MTENRLINPYQIFFLVNKNLKFCYGKLVDHKHTTVQNLSVGIKMKGMECVKGIETRTINNTEIVIFLKQFEGFNSIGQF